jgi:hypothetical protein
MNIHPGSFVQLASRHDGTYQVVNIDDHSGSCWVRRWPLSRHGSPPFSVPLHQVADITLTPA